MIGALQSLRIIFPAPRRLSEGLEPLLQTQLHQSVSHMRSLLTRKRLPCDREDDLGRRYACELCCMGPKYFVK